MIKFSKNPRGERVIDYNEADYQAYVAHMEKVSPGYRMDARRRQKQVFEQGYSD